MKDVIVTQVEALTLEGQTGFAEGAPRLNSLNEELEKTESVGDSPFTLVTREEGMFLAIGKWQVSEMLKFKGEASREEEIEDFREELIGMIRRRDWNLIMGAITSVIAVTEEYKVLMGNKLKENE